MNLNPFSQVAAYIRKSGKRVAVTVIGFAVLLAGAIMMVTPGPGILVIIGGLAILASEYAWAEKALDRAKEKTGQALHAVTASKARIALSVALTLGGIAIGVWWFFLR